MIAYHDAIKLYEHVIAQFKNHTLKVMFAGSLRRKRKEVKDIDIVAIPAYSFVPFAVGHGYSVGAQRRIARTSISGVTIEIYLAGETAWGGTLLYATGSKQFNIEMRSLAKAKGYRLNRYGLWKNNVFLVGSSEQLIFQYLEMKYIDPKDRTSLTQSDDILYRTIIPSFANSWDKYTIEFSKSKGWLCTCPHFRYRLIGTDRKCKHIQLAETETSVLT